ncbi:MAG: hypothetical protein J2P45_05545, partial [Candidatus Dormibacteraeota bacterium]|nr:hypothetical protein [Candidatus Dormibacteraeota bacterium]
MRGGGRRQIYRDPGWKYPGPTYHGPRYPRPSPRPSRPRGGGGRAALVVLLLVTATVIFVVRGPAALQRPLQGLAQRVTSIGQSGGAKLQVAGTAPSACMAYGPTGPSKNQTVFV